MPRPLRRGCRSRCHWQRVPASAALRGLRCGTELPGASALGVVTRNISRTPVLRVVGVEPNEQENYITIRPSVQQKKVAPALPKRTKMPPKRSPALRRDAQITFLHHLDRRRDRELRAGTCRVEKRDL